MFSIRSGDTCILPIKFKGEEQTVPEELMSKRVFLAIGGTDSPLLIKEIIGDTIKLEYEDTVNIPEGIYDLEVRAFTDDLTSVETLIYDKIKILPVINRNLKQILGGVEHDTITE